MRALALSLLLVLAPLAGADEPAPAVRERLAAWAAGMRGVRTLRVEFRQIKTLRVLRRPRVSTGVALLVGRRVLLTTRRDGEVETELLVDDDAVRIHVPRARRLEIYPRRGAGAGLPFPVFGGDVERLPDDHDVSLDGEELVLVPRAAGAAYAEARLLLVPVAEGASGLRVARMKQRGRRGDSVEMTITRWVVNPELAADAIALVVPPGTETVRIGGGGR